MSGTKAPHHKGSYHVQAARVRAAANADPLTICWRCRKTMAEIRKHKPRARWTAGHVIDGQVGGTLLAECSPCNYSHGARAGNQLRQPRPSVSRAW